MSKCLYLSRMHKGNNLLSLKAPKPENYYVLYLINLSRIITTALNNLSVIFLSLSWIHDCPPSIAEALLLDWDAFLYWNKHKIANFFRLRRPVWTGRNPKNSDVGRAENFGGAHHSPFFLLFSQEPCLVGAFPCLRCLWRHQICWNL